MTINIKQTSHSKILKKSTLMLAFLMLFGFVSNSYAERYMCGRVKNGKIGVNVRKVTVKAPSLEQAIGKAKGQFAKKGYKKVKNMGCTPI